jgi:hypothetical protein
MRITLSARDAALNDDPEVQVFLAQCAERMNRELGDDFENDWLEMMIFGEGRLLVVTKEDRPCDDSC